MNIVINKKFSLYTLFILIGCLGCTFLLCSWTSNGDSNQADTALDGPSMKLYDYFDPALGDPYYYESYFEYVIYTLLKKNPLKKEINYLAFPWSKAMRKEPLFSDEHIACIKQLRLDGGFTVVTYWKDEGDCPDQKTLGIILTLKQMGIDCVFTPGASKRKSYMGIQIEPLPHYVLFPVDPNCTKDILCSFVGSYTHPIREFISMLSHLPEFVIIIRQRHFYFYKERKKEGLRKEYNTILARSRFSLCPRGNEPSSPRFWESLQAGAIPILIDDNARLPDGVNWKECIIHIPETAFENNPKIIDDIIKTISPEQERKMRAACYETYSFFSGENLVRTIREYYENGDQ